MTKTKKVTPKKPGLDGFFTTYNKLISKLTHYQQFGLFRVRTGKAKRGQFLLSWR